MSTVLYIAHIVSKILRFLIRKNFQFCYSDSQIVSFYKAHHSALSRSCVPPRYLVHSCSNLERILDTRRHAAVSSVVTACCKCKQFSAQPFRQPDNSQLPSFRLDTTSSPFQNVGIDTCGPLIVNNIKTWIVIFIDLVCRNIDLEFLSDMTTDKLLHAFRRFSARHRMPAFIISNNAEQFKFLNVVLSASINTDFR